MTAYAWPSTWVPSRFRMFVVPNERAFTGYYAGQTQAVDLLGEYWRVEMDLPQSNTDAIGAAREAFFDRLRGRVNQITLSNLKRPNPRGTMRGTPTLAATASQLASTIQIQTTAGATLLAGDCIGFGNQVSRVMADATADGSGLLTVEVLPRPRTTVASGAAVTWSAPTVNFILMSGDGVPFDWTPGGIVSGTTIQLREV